MKLNFLLLNFKLNGVPTDLSVRHKMIGVKERPYKATFVVHNTDIEETIIVI